MTLSSCRYRRWQMYLNIFIPTFLRSAPFLTLRSNLSRIWTRRIIYNFFTILRRIIPCRDSTIKRNTRSLYVVRSPSHDALRFERYIASDMYNARRIRSVHDDSKTRKNDLSRNSLKTNGRKESGEGRARFHGRRSEIALLALSCWRLWSVPDSSWSRRSSL